MPHAIARGYRQHNSLVYIECMEKVKNTVRLQLLMTERHHWMLKQMAEEEYRSLNNMIRVLIERAYGEKVRGTRAIGSAVTSETS